MDVVKITFKHKWLRKEFDKRAGELIGFFGRDIVFMAIRHYCHIRLEEQDRLKAEHDASIAFQNQDQEP